MTRGSDDGSASRALGYADVLDVLEIVDGAGDECEVVVEAGDFRLRFVKEAAGEGEEPAAEPARRTLP